MDIYAKHIHNAYSDKKHKILLVLSVFPLSDLKSKRLMEENGFQPVLYKDLFAEVNKELGNYMMSSDQRYLTFMLDFMKTIENMSSVNNKRVFDFFIQNKERVEQLVNEYNQFQSNILSCHKEHIDFLKESVNERTGATWWAWEGWDLGISFNDKTNRIGIESNYLANVNGPCGEFHIYITTWQKKHWAPYKEKILETFPEYIFLDENDDDRVYLHLPTIDGNNTEEIIKVLTETYNKLKEIAEQIH